MPMTREQRKPKVPDQQSLRRNQKNNFDSRRGVRDLPELEEGELVWIPDRQAEAIVQEEVAPRSYNVSTPDGTVRRNRRDIVKMPQAYVTETLETVESTNECVEAHECHIKLNVLTRVGPNSQTPSFEKERCSVIDLLCNEHVS